MLELLQLLRDILFLAAYVGAQSSFPEPLRPSEEAACLQKLALGDDLARETLITHNLRLVAHIAKKYNKTGRDIDDLISIGTIGLIKAVSTFDPGKGAPLSSYASRCIENEILMSIRQERKQVLEISLSDAIGMDGDGNDVSFSDILGSDADLVPELAATHLQSAFIRSTLDALLSDRERKVICLRYGLIGGCCMPQREVAALLGISRSYVSRIEKRALEKLRDAFSDQTF